MERLEQMLHLCENTLNVNPMVFNVISQAKGLLSSLMLNETANTVQTRKFFSGDCGRPQFVISQEQLEFFLSYNFHCPEIGRILGVSPLSTGD